ncbi:hypothetical protein DEJ34_03875 [Curtobacterium sp. MCPF17_050]|uniref:hypothetical protein n=1 Tax=Curtobacterium sp. MCPF17_050 TaxID=2175664 RepID=UPI000D94B4B2|nr:hypothetical protein [Curtobacterium sp. MCPF17_050]WIB16282.1 hypothetical protein DEJ34_03875 [Curtobacterium sp. MCPF17_050]
MPAVTGTLRDFNIQSLAAFSPRIIFTPSGVAVSETRLYSTKPVVVVPNLGGDFEVFLQATEDVDPAVWYTIRIEWLDSDKGYVGVDLVEWKLFVPSDGGSIGDLLRVPASAVRVWVGLEPPAYPSPGTLWLLMNPDDVDDPRNTGYLYEWS